MAPLVDPNALTIAKSNKPYILIVGSHPTDEEAHSESKSYDLSSANWRLPYSWAKRLDCRWVMTTALACPPGKEELDERSVSAYREDKTPTKAQSWKK